jgi:hypothetical protein
LALGVVPGDGTEVWGKIHMNRGRVGEEQGGKEMDGCPLTPPTSFLHCPFYFFTVSFLFHVFSVNLHFLAIYFSIQAISIICIISVSISISTTIIPTSLY